MKTIEELKQTPRLVVTDRTLPGSRHDNPFYTGWAVLNGKEWTVVWSYNDDGMEHVSISHQNNRVMPSWDDMCKIKDIFFRPEEAAVQIHPAASRYVHSVGLPGIKKENILHLWRPADGNWNRLME